MVLSGKYTNISGMSEHTGLPGHGRSLTLGWRKRVFASLRERLPSDLARVPRGGHHSTAPTSLQPSAGGQLCHPWALEIRGLPMAPFFTATWLLTHPCPRLLPLPPNPSCLPSVQMRGPQLGPPAPVPKPEGTARSWSKTTYTQLAPNSIPRLPFPTEPVPGHPWPLHPCREGWGSQMQSTLSPGSSCPQNPHSLTGLEHPKARAGNKAAAPATEFRKDERDQSSSTPPTARRTGPGARRGPGGSV